ncbi:hypothetical protein [Sediminihabitans luteus]|nr:hypothetical protein [Sediminihabitans luteus]
MTRAVGDERVLAGETMHQEELRRSRRLARTWMILAIAPLALGTAFGLSFLWTADVEDQVREEAMTALEAGAPPGVEIVGSISYGIEDGDDDYVAHVANGVRGETEVLWRVAVDTGEATCADLPVRWLFFDDGLTG